MRRSGNSAPVTDRKGWLISSSTGARAGDSTPWYASFWEFCARYRSERLADLLQHGRARGRQHTLVCVVLGILRPLLRRAFRRPVAPLRGAVALAARREDGHPGAGRGVQP